MKLQFAPGAFDGTQEELAAQSRKVDFADLPEHLQSDLVDPPRTLQ
jgi:hypothetical protein